MPVPYWNTPNYIGYKHRFEIEDEQRRYRNELHRKHQEEIWAARLERIQREEKEHNGSL